MTLTQKDVEQQILARLDRLAAAADQQEAAREQERIESRRKDLEKQVADAWARARQSGGRHSEYAQFRRKQQELSDFNRQHPPLDAVVEQAPSVDELHQAARSAKQEYDGLLASRQPRFQHDADGQIVQHVVERQADPVTVEHARIKYLESRNRLRAALGDALDEQQGADNECD